MNLHSFKTLFVLILLSVSFSSSAVTLDKSFDSLPGQIADLYQPWLNNRNILTLPGGEIVHSTATILSNRRKYDYVSNTSVISANLMYAVIEISRKRHILRAHSGASVQRD